MKLTEDPAALKKFRRSAWKFQQTFETPLKNLQSFVSTIFKVGGPWKSASVTIEQAVFDPEHLIALLNKHVIPPRYERGVCITAEEQHEIEPLLCATLGDWVDFIFVPQPKSFAIYADHDEYTTFYAQTRSNLNRVTRALLDNGFRAVPDYER
jgi:hypothetical protein